MFVRVLTYNILHGDVSRSAQILRVFEQTQANIIVLQEAEQTQVVRDIAQTLNMNFYSTNSVALLSQYPIVAGYTYHSFPRYHDTMLEATLTLPTGNLLHVFGVHPIHFPGTVLDFWRNWQLRKVRERAETFVQEYCLIAGDFNAIAPADRVLLDKAPIQMRLLYWLQGGRIFTTAIRQILSAGFIDCYRQLHPHEDGFTLPTSAPKLRLDYIFANEMTAHTVRTCDVVAQPPEVDYASDHYPVIAEFYL